jgi:cell wall-associated NlpC family hydrolase
MMPGTTTTASPVTTAFGSPTHREYDCSGLTLVAWGSVGVTLGHFTGWQWNEGTPVSRGNLRPGDLVFWFSDLHHMGIYVGGGWTVHAPHTGDVVRMTKIDSPGLPIAGFRRPG